MKRRFFDSDGDCVEHIRRRCSVCREEESEYEILKEKAAKMNEPTRQLALITSTINQDKRSVIDASKQFDKTIEFIKAGSGYTDSQLSKLKVKDLEELHETARDEMTVGNMKGLLNGDAPRFSLTEKALGRLASFGRFFTKPLGDLLR